MRTSSLKSKGRALQDELRDALRALAKDLNLGLENEDIMSREMGQKGTDTRLSPRASKLLGNPITECKNCEKLNVVGAFREHEEKYKDVKGLKFLVHTRNKDKASGGKKQPRVVLISLEDFMGLLKYKIKAELAPKPLLGQNPVPDWDKDRGDGFNSRGYEAGRDIYHDPMG